MSVVQIADVHALLSSRTLVATIEKSSVYKPNF
jgi:hypothetical protein